MPKLWENQSGYRGFSTISNENAGQVNVYSPVPAKYRQQTSMVLRPRIPLKQLNNVVNVAKSQLSKKFKTLTEDSENSSGKNVIKRKVKTTFTKVAQKMNVKHVRPNSVTNNKSSEASNYRDKPKSPLTPYNPFNASNSCVRRSRRLSGLKSPETPCSKLKLRSPFTRKRKFEPDEFNSHLEKLSSGIETLKTNGMKLTKASNHMSPSPAKLMKLTENLDSAENCKSLNTTKYKLMLEGVTSNAPNDGAKSSGKLRRTMTRASIRRRTLTSRFAHSASTIEDKLHGRAAYSEMEKV